MEGLCHFYEKKMQKSPEIKFALKLSIFLFFQLVWWGNGEGRGSQNNHLHIFHT